MKRSPRGRKAVKKKIKRVVVRRHQVARKRFPRQRRPVVLRRPKKAAGPVPKPAAPKAPPEPPAPKAPLKQLLLFCPGPVNLTARVRNALAGAELCHREPEFEELLQATRAKLAHALGLGERYTAVIVGGSGTAALEAAVMAGVEPGKKLFVLNNGVYGSRIAQIAKSKQIPLVELRSPLTDPPDLDRVSTALKREGKIGTVAMVHHETSTGQLNPLEEVGKLAKKFHKRFLVDGISSLGGEKADLDKAHVGICVGSAGKCLHGPPGLSFVLLSREEAALVSKRRVPSLYLDLGLALKSQEGGEPPFTPPVHLVAGFHAALDELLREGLKKRIDTYRQRAEILRAGFQKLKLEFLLGEKQLSSVLTALRLPAGLAYEALHQTLKKAGYVVYAGQNELKNKIFRVAHMGGTLHPPDLRGFLRALEPVLRANAERLRREREG